MSVLSNYYAFGTATEVAAAAAAAAASASRPPQHWTSFFTALIHLCRLYGAQAVLVALLGTVVIYRKEMSCNRIYIEERRQDQAEEDHGGNQHHHHQQHGDHEQRELDAQKSDENSDENEDYLSIDAFGQYVYTMMAISPIVWARIAAKALIGSELTDVGLVLLNALESKIFRNTTNTSTLSSLTEWQYHSKRPRSSSLLIPTLVRLDTVPSESVATEASEGSDADVIKLQQQQQQQCPTILDRLPCDAWIQILTHLHPRDVVTFACTSQTARNLVDGDDENDTSQASNTLWNELWRRDYAWLVRDWDIGRQALSRSMDILHRRQQDFQPTTKQGTLTNINSTNQRDSEPFLPSSLHEFMKFSPPSHFSAKDIYFAFVHGWVDYTIAGFSKFDQCLVGLHGHVFDLTSFLESHPGSPETLLVQGGRDSTAYFEDVGHSLVARRIAVGLCVAADRSCCDMKTNNNNKNSSEDGTNQISSWGTFRPAKVMKSNEHGGQIIQQGGGGVRDVTMTTTDQVLYPLPMSRYKRRQRKMFGATSSTTITTSITTTISGRRPGNIQGFMQRLEQAKFEARDSYKRWLDQTKKRTMYNNNDDNDDDDVVALAAAADLIHLYFDPFVGRWMWWYSNAAFQSIHIFELNDDYDFGIVRGAQMNTTT